MFLQNLKTLLSKSFNFGLPAGRATLGDPGDPPRATRAGSPPVRGGNPPGSLKPTRLSPGDQGGPAPPPG